VRILASIFVWGVTEWGVGTRYVVHNVCIINGEITQQTYVSFLYNVNIKVTSSIDSNAIIPLVFDFYYTRYRGQE